MCTGEFLHIKVSGVRITAYIESKIKILALSMTFPLIPQLYGAKINNLTVLGPVGGTAGNGKILTKATVSLAGIITLSVICV